MRDLHDDPHPEFTAAMMADLTATAPAEALGGDFAVGRSSVHASASEGAQRLSCGHLLGPTTIAAMGSARVGEMDTEPADWLSCWIEVHNAYTAALRSMGPDPIPIVSDEPWVESDGAYAKRIGADVGVMREYPSMDTSGWLDLIGQAAGLPRARLVPVKEP